MRAIHYLVVLCLAALCNFPGQLHAQKHVQFTCMLWEGQLEQEIYYRDGESYLPIKLREGRRSAVYKLVKSKKFSLYIESKSANDGQDPYQLIGESSLIAGTGRLLFLLFPREGSPELRVMANDDSLKGFPDGSLRLINFGKDPLLVKFSDKVKKLPAKGMVDITPNLEGKGGLVPLLIATQKRQHIFNSRAFLRPGNRAIAYIFPSSKSESGYRVRLMSQLVPRSWTEDPLDD